MKKLTKGFTLIELLVVIVIIILLTSIILVDLNQSRSKARDGERISDLGQIQLALGLYYDRCRDYPQALTPDSSTACTTSDGTTIYLSDFISVIPTPPGGISGQTAYDYYPYGNPAADYILHTKLENYEDPLLNSLTENSLPGWASSYASLACYNSSSNAYDYCLGSH